MRKWMFYIFLAFSLIAIGLLLIATLDRVGEMTTAELFTSQDAFLILLTILVLWSLGLLTGIASRL